MVKFFSTPLIAMQTVLVLTLLALAGVSLYALQTLSSAANDMGQGKDVVADVLPPPLYVIEAQLISYDLLRAPVTQRASLLEKLRALKSDYNQRNRYWETSTLVPQLKSTLLGKQRQQADQFWQALTARFIPAIQAGDAATAEATLQEMRGYYEAHRQAVDATVSVSRQYAAKTQQDLSRTTQRVQWLLLAVSLAGLGVFWFALHGLNRLYRYLREGEERFRLILEQALDAVINIDETGRVVKWNAEAERIFGYQRNEAIGHDLSELIIPPLLRDAHSRGMQRFLQTGEGPILGKRIELTALRKDGTEFPVELSVGAVPQKGGVFFSAFLRDITERRQAEQQLHLSATVFESTQDGVVITDTSSHILAVNNAYQAITGYSAEEVLGKNPNMLLSGRHDRAFYQAMWASIQQTGHWRGEIWNRRKNGEIYPQLTSISEVRSDRDEVTHYVGVFTDISHIKQTEARLEHLAHYDPLTDLPNRLLLQSRMEHALESAHRHKQPLALLLIDLDRFKDVNDSLGHLAGDELLQQVVERMRLRLREEDTLARLGGDEFVVLLERLAHPRDAGRLALEIIDSLTSLFRLDSGAEVSISASIGISLYPDHGATPGELTQHADAALYLAKDHGRHTYRYYTEALTRASHDRLSMEARLRRALEDDEFVVHYQPLVDITSGCIVGAEALVRWHDPKEGIILPDRFIPIAEESGLIIPLGEEVLRAACRQAQAWTAAGLPPIVMAVNFSTRQFTHPGLAEQIRAILNETGFDPQRLELELTESALMTEGSDAVTLLGKLKTMGMRLALDDFGTGYSSLSYLRRFPLDTLKIDRSFIQEIPQHRDDMAITTAIIQLAHILGFTVLAEGVETQQQLTFIRDQGCDLYQGYLFSKALPAGEFTRLLALQPVMAGADEKH